MQIRENLQKRETAILHKLVEKQRLSEAVVGIFKTITSRKGLKKAIKKGFVYVDGKVGNTVDFVKGGETIELFQLKSSEKPIIQLDIEVLFEDDFLAVINKPAGILVSGNKKITVENALPSILKKSHAKNALSRPEPIHRLDFPTTGALLIGKTVEIVTSLNKLFESRNIEKEYVAVTMGKMPLEGIINLEVDEKASLSEFKVVETVASKKYEFLNLVRLNPKTGRRHQLRKHLASIGNPILGDKVYGKQGLISKGNGLFLHSHSLQFTHPKTLNEMKIVVQLPKKFSKIFPNLLQ